MTEPINTREIWNVGFEDGFYDRGDAMVGYQDLQDSPESKAYVQGYEYGKRARVRKRTSNLTLRP